MTTKNIGKYRTAMSISIERSTKTQGQISEEIGFPNQNSLSIIKSGKMHLGYERVIPFAKSVGINKHDFMSMVLEEREPAIFEYLNSMKEEFQAILDEKDQRINELEKLLEGKTSNMS